MKVSVLILPFSALLTQACQTHPSGSDEAIGPQSSSSGVMDTTALYNQRCAACHGTNGNMSLGGAKKLTESVAANESVLNQIRYGKGAMPPFAEMLSEDQITALASYTMSFREEQENHP
jgi:mono/diheme cytochrome c family protein